MNKWRKISIILVVLLAIEIFYISSIPAPPTGPVGWEIVPVAYHFIVFFLLSFFLFVSISRIDITTKFWVSLENERRELVTKAILILSLSAFYAMTDEYHQLFVPGRVCSFGDFMIDFAGICFGVIIYLLMVIKNEGN